MNTRPPVFCPYCHKPIAVELVGMYDNSQLDDWAVTDLVTGQTTPAVSGGFRETIETQCEQCGRIVDDMNCVAEECSGSQPHKVCLGLNCMCCYGNMKYAEGQL